MTGCATAVTVVTKYVCLRIGYPPTQAVDALQALNDAKVDVWVNELKRYYIALKDSNVCELVKDLTKVK